MPSKLLLLLVLFAPSTTLASCPDGKFFATFARTACRLWNKDSISNHTAISTQGEMSSISTATNTVCELLITPNASLGTTTVFNVKVNSITLDADSTMTLFYCPSTNACEIAYVLSNVAWTSATRTYTVQASSMKIVIRSGAILPTTHSSNTFLISWFSEIKIPCLDCANLVPVPSGGGNWLYNNAPGIGCDWKCAPGYYIPTNGMVVDATGSYITTGPVGCVPCTLCSAGTFTNPSQYDGGCWGYVGNNGAYGAMINSKNSNCKQCSSCAPAVSQACSQLSDTVCTVGVRTVAKPMISFK
jgi:hypothetical protein